MQAGLPPGNARIAHIRGKLDALERAAAAEAARREADAAALASEHRGAALAAQLAEAERRVVALDQECEEGQVSELDTWLVF